MNLSPGLQENEIQSVPHYPAKLCQSANVCAAANAVPRDSENQLQLSVLAAFVWAQSLDVLNLAAGLCQTEIHNFPHYQPKILKYKNVCAEPNAVPRDIENQLELSLLER